MNLIIVAISLGVLGSFHCVGMCGPIALALPVDKDKGIIGRIGSSLMYNLGRALTYSFFGLMVGAVGQGIVFGGYQQALSIATGIIILVLVLSPSRYLKRFGFTTVLLKYAQQFKSKFSALFKSKKYSAMLFIGIINGLLPCGLTYMALAGAIATGNAIQGALFMAFFGLGTFPVMLALLYTRNFLTLAWRNKMAKVMPVLNSIIAILLILRGLNLGIPYLSPEISKTKCESHSCCYPKY